MDASLRTKAEQFAHEMAGQAETIEDLNDLLQRMMKSGLERMLNTEMDVHLGRRVIGGEGDPLIDLALTSTVDAAKTKRAANRRNGHSKKTVKGTMGEVPLDTPRDRNGTFEPQLIGKYQRRVPGFDEKILLLYAKGMTTRDIQDIVRELYGVNVSATLVSEITADLDVEVTAAANATAGASLADRLLRRHHGERPRCQRTRLATHDVRGFRREYGGPQGTARAVALSTE